MGGGRHRNFGQTKGSIRPILKNSDVRYSKSKTEGYLLNPNHPQGASKAKFMQDILGYTQSDSKIFHRNIVESIKGKEPSKRETTLFGEKYTYNTQLKSKSGKIIQANVVVVIQKDKHRITYKIVTVYPDKKEI